MDYPPLLTMKLPVPLPIRMVVILSMLVSCQDYRQEQTAAYEEKLNNPPPYRVVVVEGCQYLRFETTHGYAGLTHKGNCSNPIHCYADTTARGSSLMAPPGQ